jgi:hypothetical protein
MRGIVGGDPCIAPGGWVEPGWMGRTGADTWIRPYGGGMRGIVGGDPCIAPGAILLKLPQHVGITAMNKRLPS